LRREEKLTYELVVTNISPKITEEFFEKIFRAVNPNIKSAKIIIKNGKIEGKVSFPSKEEVNLK
jgi:hypothetical protein